MNVLETIQSDTSQAPVAMQTTSFASNKAYQELKSRIHRKLLERVDLARHGKHVAGSLAR